MSHTVRTTFREIVDASREEAAEAAWERAKRASTLRGSFAARRRLSEAGRCGEAKAAALKLVSTLLPDEVRVTIDDDYQVGLVSVRWKGHGRFHLPAGWLQAQPAGTAVSS
jgi:hypothetical protein